ncbi:ArsR/SmtB family transcription factor [Streptomyces pristinaespiralis]|uniref:ArsR family transcriptional regulator n=3 Tax=Streptomyces pristinaespiralis TaxID=38300 RepID=A0A0M4DX85_STRPR|nr:helix-turn-helix domain-containing protein [Streptomyces pristinaespiralis]ALC24145.1 ArsR family transcriptional regulator [Streptomyces pristinaespiralis]QMU13471.1 helix-turn-helix transcriptional regulator [Streptomyces pristinaespiralis]
MLGGMTSSRDLAAFAALLADETRAAFALALLDGRAWTAGELARHGRVAPSTASEHLGKLVAGGLLTEERQGRHRYVRLADDRVAHLVEELAAHASPGPVPAPRSLRESTVADALARGRTCYDHLAGRLGITITGAMTARGLLTQDAGFALTDRGARWFAGLGIDLSAKGRRPLVRGCLDWTERRPHLAGVAGARLCGHALDAGWCVRIGSDRAVKVTDDGERALHTLLDIEPGILR